MTTKSTGELFPVLEQIERDKGIKKEDILKMIESALVSAFRKHSGRLGNIKVQVDPENGTIKAYLVKKVVNEINNPNYEMSLEEAKNFSPEVVLDTEIEIPIETEDFSRIAAQTAKQVIIQKIREIERDNLYSEFLTKKSQVLGGFVHRFVDRNIIVDLGKIEAILPLREQIRGERLNIGDRIKVYVVKVDKGPRGPQILVSRTHPELVKGLFAQEVPEVNDHTVEIVGISREPGIRSKLAMISHNQRVDPVGTCVGVHGSRIKPIIGELRGERIDLIHWDNEPGKLISQALTPAKDIKVNIINPEGKRAEVIVADAQLSMAIGKSGINVRLASRLTGWYLDIKSESEKKEELAKETTVGLTELQ
ncbi:MAG TPA: transcription termination/antitermination protein NusA, partial [Elusimicrobia bacterium]|nr:transcription termination/antitermination protein NusA [Elusimicrobiota bacterium]